MAAGLIGVEDGTYARVVCNGCGRVAEITLPADALARAGQLMDAGRTDDAMQVMREHTDLPGWIVRPGLVQRDEVRLNRLDRSVTARSRMRQGTLDYCPACASSGEAQKHIDPPVMEDRGA